MTYNIKDLTRKVSDKTGVSYKDAFKIIESTFDEIGRILINEEKEIRIKNFATFKFGEVAGKETKHPRTGEPIIVPRRKTIRLGLSTKMKRGLNNVI